jgi:type IV pilus assembly protein PilB
VVATEGSILAAIDKFYGASVSAIGREVDLAESAAEVIDDNTIGGMSAEEEASPIVKFVNAILAEAIRKKVSDIHFEPYEKRFRVRYRIDGNMQEASSQASSSAAAISSRIKIMSKLDIAEKRRPQDGRIKLPLRGGKSMDFRVSVLPTIWGEKNCSASS